MLLANVHILSCLVNKQQLKMLKMYKYNIYYKKKYNSATIIVRLILFAIKDIFDILSTLAFFLLS